LTTLAEATENECINNMHCQRAHATYILAKADNLLARFFCKSWATCRGLYSEVHAATHSSSATGEIMWVYLYCVVALHTAVLDLPFSKI